MKTPTITRQREKIAVWLDNSQLADLRAIQKGIGVTVSESIRQAIDKFLTVALKKRVRSEGQSLDTVAFALEGLGARSGGQSGDLQGLSNVQGADSESVDELLEEGNAFEADAVKGVEDAGETDGEEARTYQVPQDEVPSEYLHRKK
jgi:hypothetical protein